MNRIDERVGLQAVLTRMLFFFPVGGFKGKKKKRINSASLFW